MSIADSTGCATLRLPTPTPAPEPFAREGNRRRNSRWLAYLRSCNQTVAELARDLGRPERTVQKGIRAALAVEAEAEARAAAAAAAGLAAAAEPVAGLVGPDADMTAEERAALAESKLDLDDLVDLRKNYGPGTEHGADLLVVRFFEQIGVDDLIARKKSDGRDPRPTLVTNTLSARGALG